MPEADFLDEDVRIRNQQFCILSYTLPPPGADPKGKRRAGYDTPMIKIRGSYSSVEECDEKIEKLKSSDKYFHMYVAPVGVWGPLLTDEQHKESGTSAVYMNKDMNDFMKGYKESQDKKTDEFEERKAAMVKKAREDGTKEGQARLAAQRENPVSVRDRINETNKMIGQLKTQLKEAEDLHDAAVILFATYTQAEIDEAERQIKANALKIKEL